MSREKDIPINTKDERDDSAPDEEPAEESEVVSEDKEEKSDAAADTADVKLAKLEDRLLRTVAEFDNYKKRTANQFEQMVRSANEKLLLELLEVVDNFERALQHNNSESESDSLRQGTELIYNQLLGILAKYSVTPIESVGQPFDPNLHEAMMQTPSKAYDEGLVAMEIGKGYRLGDRVLRHAKVAVSTGAPSAEDVGSDESEDTQ